MRLKSDIKGVTSSILGGRLGCNLEVDSGGKLVMHGYVCVGECWDLPCLG